MRDATRCSLVLKKKKRASNREARLIGHVVWRGVAR